MNDDIRHELIDKLLKGEATWEEKQQLAQSGNVELKMQRQWEASGGAMEDKEMEERVWKQVLNRSVNKRREKLLPIYRMVAAACIFVAILAGIYWLTGTSCTNADVKAASPLYAFHARENCSYTLPDASTVWMKAGSTLRYPKDFATDRRVWLEGESVFEVTRDEKHLFRVYTGQAFVEVKGTVFNVIGDREGNCEVTLYNGKVEFNVRPDEQAIVMKPGQRLAYDANDGAIALKNVSRINWQQGRYRFANVLMADLFRNISDIYHVQVKFAGNIPLHHRFTGFIRYDETLEEVFGKICVNTELEVRREADGYVIYNK